MSAPVRHGHSRRGQISVEYSVWMHMRDRVRNPRHRRYADYGGRGITIAPRWERFEAFLADMGERPPGLSLDRIDPDGPYAPENCRWADASTQAKNRRQDPVRAHCGGRDGSPRCGYFANHHGLCQTPPEDGFDDEDYPVDPAWEAAS